MNLFRDFTHYLMPALLSLAWASGQGADVQDEAEMSGPEIDADERGPFAVGFTSLVTMDERDLGLVFRESGYGSARPVPMMIFYPAQSSVDQLEAAGAQRARYPPNPFPLPSGAPPPPLFYGSASFELYGIDAAFQEPSASSAGPFPLVVLLAGGRAPYWFNLGLATRVASHGFVVVLLAHYGENAYGGGDQDPRDPIALGNNTALQRGLNRMYDAQLAIDVLLSRSAAANDLLEGRIDGTRIAAGGHSLGGLSALQLVGGDDDLCNTYEAAARFPPCNAGAVVPAPIHESRIRALLLLEPSGQLLHWHELRRVSAPAILLTRDPQSLESSEPPLPGWLAGWGHQALGGEPSYLTSIVHTDHVPSFTSACAAAKVRGRELEFRDLRCEDNPADPANLTPYRMANALVWRYAVAFLQTELAGRSGYQRMLTPGWSVSREPLATFFVNERRNGEEPPAPFGDVSYVHLTQPNPDFEDHPIWLEP